MRSLNRLMVLYDQHIRREPGGIRLGAFFCEKLMIDGMCKLKKMSVQDAETEIRHWLRERGYTDHQRLAGSLVL